MQNLKCKIVNVKIADLLYFTFQYSTHSFTNNYTNFDLYHHPPDFQFNAKIKVNTKTLLNQLVINLLANGIL